MNNMDEGTKITTGFEIKITWSGGEVITTN